MPRRKNPSDNERAHYVVWPSRNGVRVGPPTFCDTLRAAQNAIEESREKDEYGWSADYAIRQMTASEVAYELLAAA